MRVYISAAHSCGKSTLARYISEKYNLPMVHETARMILSEKELNINSLRTDLNVVDNYQRDIFKRQLLEEEKHIDFVSDRSFDFLAYSAQHTRILPELLSDPMLLKYIEKLREPDSYIFFIRPSKSTLKDDGIRETLNWDGVVAIDAMIKLLLQMFGLRYFMISTDSMQERAQLVDAILSLKK